MSDAPILYEREGDIARITLNRPERRNALGRELVSALHERFVGFAEDDELRVVVITGAGQAAFCAGADLKERTDMGDDDVRTFLADLRETLNAIERCPVPVIAAINGYALGGGLELALACDLRIASRAARLGLTEVRLGIIPGAGGTQRLPRIVGVARAKELIFTARRLDANQALAIDLVHEVVDEDQVVPRSLEVAREIRVAAPLAIRQAKRAIDEGVPLAMSAALDKEAEMYAPLLDTYDRVEALDAFTEKRPPEFEGR